MRLITSIILGILSLTLMGGCQITQQITQKVTGDFKKIGILKKTAKKSKQSKEGYLLKGGERKIIAPLAVVSKEEEEGKQEKFDKYEKGNLTKSELKKLLRESDGLCAQERKNNEILREEILQEKRMFQKMIFNYAMRLDNERSVNQELKGNLIKAEMKSVQAEQKFREVQMSIMTRMNLFYAGYPFYYEVKKGDSLWRIARKKEIYDNPYKWLEIYYANKDKINKDDEYRIYPGVTLKIPRYYEALLSSLGPEDALISDFKDKNSP